MISKKFDEASAAGVRNEGFDLSFLSDFVTEILSSTESVKNVLEIECNEARYVLRACPIEMIVTKEIDEACCTCHSKVLLENRTKEIVDGIGRALVQAQELREKIAINISKEKRKMQEPDVETIYRPANKQITKKGQIIERPTRITKSSKPDNNLKPSVSSSTSKVSVDTSQGKSLVNVQKSPLASGKKSEIKPKTIAEKKLLRLSAGNTMDSKNNAKGKSAKNFVAANKSNIKNLQRNSKSTTDLTYGIYANSRKSKQSSELSPLSGTPQSLSGCSTSIAELNDLMSKVSVEAATSSSTSCLEAKDPDCPYHGTNAQKMVQQHVRSTVDMMEGLDRFGIPGEVARILKIYHSYTNKELSSDEIVDKRSQKAANRFIMEFDKMNEDRMVKRKNNYLALTDMIVGFASLFRNSYDQSLIVTRNLTEMSRRYAELDFRSKTSHLQKFDPMKFRKMKNSASSRNYRTTPRGWLSNGVWNQSDRDSFPDSMKAHCIRYANKDQLLSFFDLNQRLQLLLYHRNLVDLLMAKVIPNVLESFDRDSMEYSDAYKMIFTIAQALNPRTSVLVRTDV